MYLKDLSESSLERLVVDLGEELSQVVGADAVWGLIPYTHSHILYGGLIPYTHSCGDEFHTLIPTYCMGD